MKNIMKNINKLAIAIFLLSMVSIVNASPVVMSVTPINNNVQPGQTATYTVDLTNPAGTGANEVLNNIYVTPSAGAGDVTFTFTQTTGTILEGETLSITLSAQVPGNKPVDTYTFDVYANVGTDIGGEIIEPEDSLGNPIPYQYLNVVLNVAIPEFPTIAIPVISVLGLMFITKRRKERS